MQVFLTGEKYVLIWNIYVNYVKKIVLYFEWPYKMC